MTRHDETCPACGALGLPGQACVQPCPWAGRVVARSRHKLDGDFLVLESIQYDDGWCRAAVVFRTSSRAAGTTILLQRRSSMELAVAAISRDLSTYAARALATLPTIGLLADEDEDTESVNVDTTSP